MKTIQELNPSTDDLLKLKYNYQPLLTPKLDNINVEHYILLELLYKRVKCVYVLKLIRQFLRAPIQINGKLHKRRKGVPQGSPLAPPWGVPLPFGSWTDASHF